MFSKPHIAVLVGGVSGEREVSLSSGANVIAGLSRLGYRVSSVDAGFDIYSQLLSLKPDIVFNSLHGFWGEDGHVQAILETLKIPYTHSGLKSSALAMDKNLSKCLLSYHGFNCPRGLLINSSTDLISLSLFFPCVLKPNNGGSSFGVEIFNTFADLVSFWPNLLPNQDYLLEEYIVGLELTCGVFRDRATAVTSIIPVADNFYNYNAKYLLGGSEHVLPANISLKIYVIVRQLSLDAHKILGCRGVTRSDFILRNPHDDSFSLDDLFFLEIMQPGMTSTSLLPEALLYEGISFDEMLEYLICDASLYK